MFEGHVICPMVGVKDNDIILLHAPVEGLAEDDCLAIGFIAYVSDCQRRTCLLVIDINDDALRLFIQGVLDLLDRVGDGEDTKEDDQEKDHDGVCPRELYRMINSRIGGGLFGNGQRGNLGWCNFLLPGHFSFWNDKKKTRKKTTDKK